MGLTRKTLWLPKIKKPGAQDMKSAGQTYLNCKSKKLSLMSKKFFQTKSDALSILKTTRNAAATGGAITSMVIVGTIAYQGMLDFLHPVFAGFLAILAIALVAFVVDYGLRKTLPFGFDILIAGEWRKDWKIAGFLFLLFVVNAGQVYTSLKLSWEGRKEAAAAIQPDLQVKDLTAINSQVTASNIRERRGIENQIKAISTQIREKEKQTIAAYPTYTEKIKSGDDKWGWHAGQLEKKKEKATADLRSQKTDLIASLASLTKTQTMKDSLTLFSAATINAFNTNEYVTNKDRNMKYIGYFGAGCVLLVPFLSLMLSLIGQNDTEEVEQKEIKSPMRRLKKTATAPHAAIPARSSAPDDFEVQRRLEMLHAQAEQERKERERLEEEIKRKEEQQAQAEQERKELQALEDERKERERQAAKLERIRAQKLAELERKNAERKAAKKAQELAAKQAQEKEAQRRKEEAQKHAQELAELERKLEAQKAQAQAAKEAAQKASASPSPGRRKVASQDIENQSVKTQSKKRKKKTQGRSAKKGKSPGKTIIIAGEEKTRNNWRARVSALRKIAPTKRTAKQAQRLAQIEAVLWPQKVIS